GIFLIIVTQRPSTKILSGDIKANITSRFAFNLGSNTNYRTVFDSGIPYNLMGKGDGVFKVESYPKDFQRFQSPIISINQEEESEVYRRLSETYSGYDHGALDVIRDTKDSTLNQLKKLIATTGETRVGVLREKLSIKMETLSSLMNRLVDEGWLEKHKSRAKG